MKKTQDLSTGNITKHLANQTIPMIWGILSIFAVQLADAFFISQISEHHVAALGFVSPITLLLNGLAFGVGTGVSSVISRAIGENQYENVQTLTTHAILLAIAIAILFAVIGIMTVEPVFTRLGADQEMLKLIREFINVWYLGCFMIVIPMVGNSCIRASGNTQLPSLVMITVAVVNLILDPIFIFGWFGLPAMGLKGAALATLIAYSVALSVSLYFLIFQVKFVQLKLLFKNPLASWCNIFEVGFPAILTNLIAPLSVTAITWLVAQHGQVSVGAFAIAARIEQFAIVPIIALASVMGPFTGQNFGAKQYKRLHIAINRAIIFSFIWTLLIWGASLFLGGFLASLFTDDKNMQDIIVTYLVIVCPSHAFIATFMIVNSGFNGLGKPKPVLMLTFFRVIGIYIPLAMLFNHLFDLVGIWYALSLTNLLIGISARIWWSISAPKANSTHYQ